MFNDNLSIVDVETTGMSPFHDRVIEIAVIRIEKNRIVDKFSSLVNPEMRLSPYISSFTGITPDDLADAPVFEDVKNRLIDLLEDSVFVAHNVRFDYSFIKNELKRTGFNFRAKTFCTVRMSRALYPDFRSHSLESVINRFNFKFSHRHRALDDADVLWQFIKKVKKTFPKSLLTETWNKLTKSLYSADRAIRTQVDDLPEAPGVYIFYDKNDTVLYVGKSKNISDRVISHFSEDVNSTKHLNLMKETVRIGHMRTVGELGALLLESRLIKELKPIYNSRLVKKKAFHAVIKDTDKKGFNVLRTQVIADLTEVASSDLLGIFNSRVSAKEFLEEFSGKYSICKKQLGLDSGKGACFNYKIGKCRGVCAGRENKKLFNSRFLIAFIESRQFSPWPFKGPVDIVEKDESEDTWESFTVDRWSLLSRKNSFGEEEKFDAEFDPDIYRIINRHIKTGKTAALKKRDL